MPTTTTDDEYRMKGVKQPPQPTKGFELIVGPADGVIENADVVVRWCVDPSVIKRLEDQGVKKPMVLLETCDERGRTGWRSIVPLGDLQSYARFYRSGKQHLFAMIFDAGDDPERAKTMERGFRKRYDGLYEWMMQLDGELNKDDTNEYVEAITHTTVDIPEGVFGKEPGPRMKWYVNLWHEGTPEDQCAYRKRRAWAFSIKWIPVTVYVLWYSIIGLISTGLVYLAGFKSWIKDWKAAFHPFDGSWAQLFNNSEGEYQDIRDSRYVFWKKWKHTKDQPIFATFMLSPTMVIVYAFFPLIVALDRGGDFWWYNWHMWTAWIAAIAVGTMALIDIGGLLVYKVYNMADEDEYDHSSNGSLWGAGFMVTMMGLIILGVTLNAPWWVVTAMWVVLGGVIVFAMLFNKWTTIITNFSSVLDKMYIHVEDLMFGNATNDYTEIRELLCPKDAQNLSTDIKDIPRERRTWRLRFKNFKAKICKPMQR